jgi:hypothetical protein
MIGTTGTISAFALLIMFVPFYAIGGSTASRLSKLILSLLAPTSFALALDRMLDYQKGGQGFSSFSHFFFFEFSKAESRTMHCSDCHHHHRRITVLQTVPRHASLFIARIPRHSGSSTNSRLSMSTNVPTPPAGATLSSLAVVTGNYALSDTVIMLCVDIVIYLFLAWYFDHVLPTEGQVPHPWYFLFAPSYWCPASITDNSSVTSSPSSAQTVLVSLTFCDIPDHL